MKNKNIKEKSNKKIVVEFVAFLVVSLLVGFTVGFFTGYTDELGGRDKAIELLKTSIMNSVPVLLIITATLGIVIPLFSFSKCKSMYDKLQKNMEDDDLWDTLEEKLNSEKKGNILDSNFHKVWLDSCDEAQKMTAYKSGYKAFITTNNACSVIFVIGFFIIELFNLDIFALVLVAIIMGINNITYMVTGTKLEKRK